MIFHLRNSNGQVALYLLIVIVIIGAFFLVSGGEEFNYSKAGTESVGAPFENSNVKRDALQLNTLKFKPCTSQFNIDLLLDRSGSMDDKTASGVRKIDSLKDAVKAMTQNISDESLVGIQSFDGDSITDDVTISPYAQVKGQIPLAVDALNPGGNTPTKEALDFSYAQLASAKAKYPGKKITFIFVTDGIPNPASQDPRLFNPNPADQIKALGFPVFTVGVHSPGDGGKSNNFAPLLRSIASTPSNYYEAPTGDEIKKLLTQIKEKVCDSPTLTPTP